MGISLICLILAIVSYFAVPLYLRASNWLLLAILSAIFGVYARLETKG